MWRRTRTTRDEGMSTVDRELVLETAKIMLSRTSPEELAILDDEAARYFAGPPNVPARRRRDEPIGFGLDLALVAPYALAIGTTVVNAMGSILADEARDSARPAVAKLIRRALRRGPQSVNDPPITLSAAQATAVRQAALVRAEQLGLPRDRAELLADAVIGGLAVEVEP